MNKNQNLSFLDYTPATLPPAQLFIGQHDQALQAVEELLQKILCPNIIKSIIPTSPTVSNLLAGVPGEERRSWG